MDGSALFHGAVHDPDENDNAAVGIIEGVKNQSFQGLRSVSAGSRNPVCDLLQHLIHIKAGLCGNLGSVLSFDANDILDLVDDPLRIGTRKVDLVDDRENVEVVVQSQINVGQGLSLNTLSGIHHEDCSVAGCQTSGNLIVEVHMARGVNEVEDILLAILGVINRADSLGFDRDSALPLQFHVVQHLLLHLTLREKTGHLDDAVRQGGFSMVDVCNNTKISDFALVHCHSISS